MAETNYWQQVAANRSSRRRFLRGAVVSGAGLSAAALLAACGSGSSSSSTSSSGTAGATADDANVPLAATQTLKNRFQNDLLKIDPATIFGIEQESTAVGVYSGLTRFDVDTNLIPDLAKSWEVSPDGLTYTFHLNPAKWQRDYGDVTADDVAYSYNRVIQGKGSYAWEFNLVDSIKALDPSTAQIKLKKPYANFLYVVANYHQGQILSRAAMDKLGDSIWATPVGSGPFIVDNITPGQGFKMTRHDQYFRGPATVPSMEFRRIDTADTAAVALVSGEIDTYMFVNETVWDRIASNPALKITQAKNTYPQLWLLNTSIPALADARVRQAINYAIDWGTVVQTTTPHTSAAANSIIPDWVTDYSADIPKYGFDAKKAKDLLAAAGANNLSFKFLLSSSPSDAAQLQQSYLAAVGIKMDFEVTDRSGYNNRRTTGDFEVSSRGLPGAFIEELIFNYLHPDNAVPNGFNAARYNNPALTAKMEEARSELDAKKRTALWADVQKTVMTDLPYLPATFSHQTWASRADLKGFQVNRMAEIDWYPLKIAKT